MLLFNPFKIGNLNLALLENNKVVGWVEPQENCGIVLLEPFDLTATELKRVGATALVFSRRVAKAAAAEAAAAARAASAGGRWADRALAEWAKYDDVGLKAQKELDEFGKVKGHKALVAGSNQTVWLSQYDVDSLKAHNASV